MSNPACGCWMGSNEFCPGPGPSSLGGRLGMGVLPRNFLGGLSRSPAAGSTTQRSSTNLGDKIAQSVGEKGPSTRASLPRGRGFRASERPPKNPSPSLSNPPQPIKSFPFLAPLLKGMGEPQGKHRDTPGPPLTPALCQMELEMSHEGVRLQSGLPHTADITLTKALRPCYPDLKGQWAMEEGKGRGVRETETKSERLREGGRER